MRTILKFLALGGMVLLLAATSMFAQKIKSDYDKSNDFTRYKRYAIGENYLITRQRPEDQARIDKVLVESLNRQLQAKGFILDEKNPDFRIKYEAGALPRTASSGKPDNLYGAPLDAGFGLNGIAGIPPVAWAYVLAKVKLTVTDVGSGQPVWTVLASQKINDPQKVMNDLNTKIDDFMAKILKSFPPASKPQ